MLHCLPLVTTLPSGLRASIFVVSASILDGRESLYGGIIACRIVHDASVFQLRVTFRHRVARTKRGHTSTRQYPARGMLRCRRRHATADGLHDPLRLISARSARRLSRTSATARWVFMERLRVAARFASASASSAYRRALS